MVLSIFLLLVCCPFQAQPLSSDTTAALNFTRSVSVPLNGLKLYDRAMEAWKWTFGQEPGAELLRTDREAGVIEGTARVNYRSAMLTNREETMGTIRYRIIINIRPGECRTVITELVHTGNRSSPGNGIHLGLLTRSLTPMVRTPGMGRANATRAYAEIKEHAAARIHTVLQAFDARVRATDDP
jgi:hypothetical protein